MKSLRKFQPTISGHRLESRTLLSHTGSTIASVTAHVARVAPAGEVTAASTHPETTVQAEKNTRFPSPTQTNGFLQARNQLIEGRLTSIGAKIAAAVAASPGSKAARGVLSDSFWARVNRLDQLQNSVATAIHATNPSQLIQDPIVSVPSFHNALQTLIANNSAWFSSHPGSQRIALDLKYEGDFVGTYTGTWNDAPGADAGTITLQITSFQPSANDPTVGDLRGTISIAGVANQLPVKGQMTSHGFTLSYHPSDLVGIIPPPFISSVTISGGSPHNINGAIQFSDVVLISTAPTGGKGTLQKA